MATQPITRPSRWTGVRRRRTDVEIAGVREAAAIAATLGRELKNGRQARRLTQAQVGQRIGVTHARIGDLERGHGAGAPIGLWIAAGIAVGRPLAITTSRSLEHQPRDAGHLSAQEHVLQLARANGVAGTFELPTRPAPSATYIDVGLRDDRHRTLEVIEVWNRLDDVGAGSRSFRHKLSEAMALAVVAGGDGEPYRVAGCWVLRASAANRELVGRYPAIFETQFAGSSRGWVGTLTRGTPPPIQPGLVWIDLAATRICEARLGRQHPTERPSQPSGSRTDSPVAADNSAALTISTAARASAPDTDGSRPSTTAAMNSRICAANPSRK